MGTNQEANFTDRVKGPDKEWKSNPSRVFTKLGRVGLFLPQQFLPHREMLEGAENQLTYIDSTWWARTTIYLIMLILFSLPVYDNNPST